MVQQKRLVKGGQKDTARHGTTRHDTTRHDTARHGTARHGTARHGTARHGTTRHDTTRHDMTRGKVRWATKNGKSVPSSWRRSGAAAQERAGLTTQKQCHADLCTSASLTQEWRNSTRACTSADSLTQK